MAPQANQKGGSRVCREERLLQGKAGEVNDGRTAVPAGLLAGFVGATMLAAWFLVLDTLAGVPFYTPTFLGRILFRLEPLYPGLGPVVLLTLVHYLVFLALGLLSAWVVKRLPPVPSLLIGVIVGFLPFQILFYGAILVGGPQVALEVGWPTVLVGSLLAGVAMAGTIHFLEQPRGPGWVQALRAHPAWIEGLQAGVLGAILVAGWFFVLDLVRGQPLMTPAALGSAVFLGSGTLEEVSFSPWIIAGYTVLHLAFFLVIGLGVAILLARGRKTPHLLVAAALVFVVAEVLFLGFLAMAAEFLLGVMTLWAIASGNLLAALGMGFFLGRRHPDLGSLLDGSALGWGEGQEGQA